MTMKIIKNENTPISETLTKMVNLVDEALPDTLNIDEVFEMAKDAWNLSNSKDSSSPFLTTHPFKKQVKQMIAFKKQEQPSNENMIVEVYFGKDERVFVKSQHREDYDKAALMESLSLLAKLPEPPEHFEMVDRNAVLVAPKKTFFAWLNTLHPDDPVKEHQVKEHTIYLIHETGNEEGFEDWLILHYEALFEEELYQWHMNEADWPQKRDYTLFKKWFRVQLHSMVMDFESDELTKE